MGFGSVDEPGHRLAGMFVGLGSHLAEVMHSTVDVAVLVKVIVTLTFNHAQRFLGGRRIVEIDQRLAIDLLVEDRALRKGYIATLCTMFATFLKI